MFSLNYYELAKCNEVIVNGEKKLFKEFSGEHATHCSI